MSWCWVRCSMLRRLRLTSLVNPSLANSPRRRRGRGEFAEALRDLYVLCASAVIFFFIAPPAGAQNLQAKVNDIRAAVDAREFERAESLVRELRTNDQAAFTRNNYDYLLARLLERRGARS